MGEVRRGCKSQSRVARYERCLSSMTLKIFLGVESCESCKNFFLRCFKNNKVYACKFDGKCDYRKGVKNPYCKGCRSGLFQARKGIELKFEIRFEFRKKPSFRVFSSSNFKYNFFKNFCVKIKFCIKI